MSTPNTSVSLREVAAETERAIIALSVADSQKGFVAPSATSLAPARFAPEAWYRAICLGAAISLGCSGLATGQTAASGAPATPALNLYAVEIKTGPGWDAAKPPQEQLHFREHSANLKRLRDAGQLVLGARYADKGLVVLQAVSAEEAHAMMRQDPAIQGQVFTYALHDFNVFYGGAVQTKRRSP